jgi:hypothetical protein
MAAHEAINNVRRKINEVMKQTDERIVVGWRPEMDVKREEGDVWTDLEGKKWTIKNGIKQTVTKLDAAKTPWFCPQCQKAMNSKLDDKTYNSRGKCFDCAIKEETKMRYEGTWEAYAKEQMQKNYIAGLRDQIAELQHYYNTVSAPEFVHADSEKILMVEKWDVDVEKIKIDLQKDIEELTAHLNELLENTNGTTEQSAI